MEESQFSSINDKYYIHKEAVHNNMAPNEVVPLIMELTQPKSVLDVGCGIGTWLKAFDQFGIQDYMGVDASYVDRNLLKISEKLFRPQDLRKSWNLNRKFDLVISLEVAEHLDAEYAMHFVDTLVNHGDVVVFSAAIPGQSGQNHINEQWLSYWQEKFAQAGYILYDAIRPKIWTNEKVDIWYKQNMVFFCKEGHPLNEKLKKSSTEYIDIVHPDMFSFYRYQAERAQLYEEGKLGLKSAFDAFIKALFNKLN